MGGGVTQLVWVGRSGGKKRLREGRESEEKRAVLIVRSAY